MICLIAGVPFSISEVLTSPTPLSPLIFVACVALTIIGTGVFALPIFAGCRILGGSATFVRHFIYCNYLKSVAIVIMFMFLLLGFSIIMAINIDLYEKLIKPETLTKIEVHSLSAKEKLSVLSFGALVIVGLASAFFWFVGTWGAFRIANKFSFWRSISAFGVALMLEIPVLIAVVLMCLGI